MHLLHDHPTMLATARNQKDSDLDMKEKQSSNASLLIMNPVASGDNVTTGLPSAHKLKEELPPLVPCCEGRELQINEDLVRSGLSAISVKHDNVTQCLSSSRACEKIQILPGLVKASSESVRLQHRNSYRCLHRPDLKRVPYLRRMTPDELEMLFRGHADFPSRTQCTDNEVNTSRVILPPDENIRNRDLRTKESALTDELQSGAEDVPVGMRLHGARARLYTSVLAGTRAGDQLNCDSVNEVLEDKVPDEVMPEDEIQLNEELQIILPPRCDEITAESSTTSNYTCTS